MLKYCVIWSVISRCVGQAYKLLERRDQSETSLSTGQGLDTQIQHHGGGEAGGSMEKHSSRCKGRQGGTGSQEDHACDCLTAQATAVASVV